MQINHWLFVMHLSRWICIVRDHVTNGMYRFLMTGRLTKTCSSPVYEAMKVAVPQVNSLVIQQCRIIFAYFIFHKQFSAVTQWHNALENIIARYFRLRIHIYGKWITEQFKIDILQLQLQCILHDKSSLITTVGYGWYLHLDIDKRLLLSLQLLRIFLTLPWNILAVFFG